MVQQDQADAQKEVAVAAHEGENSSHS
jgi:hypothetical protein